MHRITTAHYTRISKREARRLYDEGIDLYFCPVNLNPESPWGLLYGPVNHDVSFDDHVSLFENFNCVDSQTGRYTAFYIDRPERGNA